MLPGSAPVEIDPLKDAAIEPFLRRWCEALFADSQAEVADHCAELLGALRARFQIRRLARNPVMLTALAVVHWNEKRLPEEGVGGQVPGVGGAGRAQVVRQPS